MTNYIDVSDVEVIELEDDTQLEYPPTVYWTTTDLKTATIWARTRKVYQVFVITTSNHTRYHVRVPAD